MSSDPARLGTCAPCGEAILTGHLCRTYDDVGEAHAICDDPFGLTVTDPDRIDADPDEWEPGKAPSFLKTHRAAP